MAQQAINHKMDRLYAALTAEERVRLLARFTREQNDAETDRLREATPPEHSEAYNRAVHILNRLHMPLGPIVASLLYAAERDEQALLALYHVFLARLEDEQHIAIMWELIPYPVTESEYAALRVIERTEPMLLDHFAVEMAELADDEVEALGEHSAFAAWRAAAPDDVGHDTAVQQCRALLEQAVRAKALPKPKRTKEGPALPRGVLRDWIYGYDTRQAPLDPPDVFVPALELLEGYLARWEVRPDAEAEAVHERREQILRTLARVRRIPRESRLTIHPPQTHAEREAAYAALEAAQQQVPVRDEVAAVKAVGERHASVRTGVHVLREVLEQIQREEFGGEDPLTPAVRQLFEQAEARIHGFAEAWARAGKDMGALEPVSLVDAAPLLRQRFWELLCEEG